MLTAELTRKIDLLTIDPERKRRAYHAEKYNNPEQNNATDDQRYVTPCILQITLYYCAYRKFR